MSQMHNKWPLKACPHQQHVEATRQSNMLKATNRTTVAVLATGWKKLNTLNFRRQLERPSSYKVLSIHWSSKSNNGNKLPVASICCCQLVASTNCWCVRVLMMMRWTHVRSRGPHRPLWPVYGEYLYLPPQRWIHSLEVYLRRSSLTL